MEVGSLAADYLFEILVKGVVRVLSPELVIVSLGIEGLDFWVLVLAGENIQVLVVVGVAGSGLGM